MKAFIFFGMVAIAAAAIDLGERDECPSMCFALWSPLCGSDGKTYSNGCKLGIVNCKRRNQGQEEVTATPGSCSGDLGNSFGVFDIIQKRALNVDITEDRGCPLMCPMNYDPVCAANGKTYSNKCQVAVEECLTGKPILILLSGRCETPVEQA